MRKYLFIFVMGLFAIQAYPQETLTITTYYPAPFGVYTNLRLFPSNQPACNANEYGTMYYDRNTNQTMVCSQNSAGNPAWQGIGLWTRNGNNVFLSDSNWNVGIGGMTSPTWKVQVTDDSTVNPFAQGVAGLKVYNPRVAANNLALFGLQVGADTWQFRHEGTTSTWGLNNFNILAPGAGSPAFSIATTGSVGVGTTAPRARLHVAGGVMIGDDTCDATKNGTLRYTSANALQYCHNGAWVSPSGGNFGGMYQKGELMAGEHGVVENNCETPNPFTGHCTCPAGFTDTALSKTEEPVDWGRYRWDENHFCWKP